MNYVDETTAKWLVENGINIEDSNLVIIPNHKNIKELVRGLGYSRSHTIGCSTKRKKMEIR